MVMWCYHTVMEGTTITFPPWMVSEIDNRIDRSGGRSRYVREAVQARMDAEDAGEWDTPEVDLDGTVAADGGREE